MDLSYKKREKVCIKTLDSGMSRGHLIEAYKIIAGKKEVQ